MIKLFLWNFRDFVGFIIIFFPQISDLFLSARLGRSTGTVDRTKEASRPFRSTDVHGYVHAG